VICSSCKGTGHIAPEYPFYVRAVDVEGVRYYEAPGSRVSGDPAEAARFSGSCGPAAMMVGGPHSARVRLVLTPMLRVLAEVRP